MNDKPKILLIYPPMRLNDMPRNFPNGIGLIASIIRQAGYDVDVLDINGWRYSSEKVIQFLKNKSCDVIGIGGLITAYGYVKWLISQIRKLKGNIPIVVGGYLGSNIPRLLLEKTEVDYVVVGEGEYSVPELLEALSTGQPPKIQGVWFRENGKVVDMGQSRRFHNMDALPYPAWDMFPMEEVYLKLPVTGFGRDLDLITSRGCPYQCTYCYKTGGRVYRQNSAEYIIEEIKFLIKEYKVNFISFQDNEFMADRKRVQRFCELMRKEKLPIKWTATSRVNLVDEEILNEMKASGCVAVSFGIESGSQKILDTLKKGVTVEQAVRAINLVKKVGLKCFTSFMVGSPGETMETIKETIEFCKKTNIALTSCMFTTPYPGTELYQWAQAHSKVPSDLEGEEEYILKLNDCVDFTVNLTDFSDLELIKLREWMISETHKNYVPPTPQELKRQFIELYGQELFDEVIEALRDKKNVEHFKTHGFNMFLELLPLVH